MRVMVIGGSGFVGGHVVDTLQKAGHDVFIGDVKPSKWHPTTMFEPVDVASPSNLGLLFDGVQVVMHLAAVSNTQIAVRDPVAAVRINCLGTTNVLQAALNAGVERVVVAGSSLVSGLLEPHEMDWPEDRHTKVDELVYELDPVLDSMVTDEMSPVMIAGPHHPYVTTKLFQEMIARDFTETTGLQTTVLRYGIQYGPRMTPGVVFHSFIERALRGDPLIVHGDGQQWRQYLHVADMAKAHLAVLDHWDESANATFNIVPERKVTIAEIADAVCQVIPKTTVEYGPARPDDVEVNFCLAGRAKSQLGWEAEISLDDGVASTVEWYRRHQASGMPRGK